MVTSTLDIKENITIKSKKKKIKLNSYGSDTQGNNKATLWV